MSKLSHFNDNGQAHMVDVGDKAITRRIAIAEGHIEMLADTLQLVISGNHKKGDVLGIARIAGIMAAKRTADLIPLCHPLPLTHVNIEFEINPPASRILCRCTTETRHLTGVEMEALTATQVALLTIYDMCKAVDRGMTIGGVCVVEKRGGKSGDWRRQLPEPGE